MKNSPKTVCIFVCRFFPIRSSWLKARRWMISYVQKECWLVVTTRHLKACLQFSPWRIFTCGGYQTRTLWSQILGHQNCQNWLVSYYCVEQSSQFVLVDTYNGQMSSLIFRVIKMCCYCAGHANSCWQKSMSFWQTIVNFLSHKISPLFY